MDINVALLQRFINFVKKTSGGIAKNENVSNKGLSELHKPIITKFKKRKLHPPFIDNIQAQMCNWKLNLKKNLKFYYVLMTFIAYMHGWFL